VDYCRKYLYSLVLLSAILVWHDKVFCQTDSVKLGNNDTLLKSETLSQKHTLYCGTGYGSNMIYLESTISRGRPYYSVMLTYGFMNSFYLSVSSSHIERTSPFMAFSSLAVSYRHTFNKWFDISADLAGYKTAKVLEQTLFSDFAFINFTSGFDWKILYTKLSLGAVFSVNNKGYIQLKNSRYFQTHELFNGKAFISFDPDVNLLFGDVVRIKTILGTVRYGYSSPLRYFRRIQHPTIESISSTFGLMNIEFSLPVTLNCRNFSIEGEPGYFLPAYKNKEYPAPSGFSYFMTVYIRII
jgi:hypothetical protein